MTVEKFLSEVSSKEITEWIAFYNLQEYEQNQKMQQRKQEANVKKSNRGRL